MLCCKFFDAMEQNQPLTQHNNLRGELLSSAAIAWSHCQHANTGHSFPVYRTTQLFSPLSRRMADDVRAQGFHGAMRQYSQFGSGT